MTEPTDPGCDACGRPRTPDHDASVPGPTVRHPYRARGGVLGRVEAVIVSDLHIEVVLRPDIAVDQLTIAADLLRAASTGELDFGAVQRWLNEFEEFAGLRDSGGTGGESGNRP